jgi:hypothetical protein
MNLNSDFKWCIENDWQVYIKIINTLHCKIAIRKGGISTNGRDHWYDKEKGLTLYSKEHLGKEVYRCQKKAMNKLPEVYKYLRDNYER